MGAISFKQSMLGLGLGLGLGATLAISAPAAGSNPGFQIDLNQLMNETQVMSNDPNRMAMAWWIPAEFWQASMGADPTVSQQEIDEVVNTLSGYTIMGALDGTINAMGGVSYRSEADVRSSLTLTDMHGVPHTPLTPDKVNPEVHTFLRMMKPVLENILGPMGENLHFFVFPAKSEKNQALIAPKARGTFSVSIANEQLSWRLPLGSIMRPHSCPACSEKLSGAFSFCPWDGAPLTGRAAATPAESTASVTEESH